MVGVPVRTLVMPARAYGHIYSRATNGNLQKPCCQRLERQRQNFFCRDGDFKQM